MEISRAIKCDYTPEEERKKQITDIAKEAPRPDMKSLHVVSKVRNRYARTVVTSKYVNLHTKAQEATFSIVLPDTAFITGFIMVIKDNEYKAHIKEKEEAKKEYDQAIIRGKAAAHVAVSARDSNNFTVSVNVEPQSDVTFILTYEELLMRKHGKYEMVVNLYPGQLIDDLSVDIHINESRPIFNVETPALRTGNKMTNDVRKNELATIRCDEDGEVHVNFHPTLQQQKVIAKALEVGEGSLKEVKPEGIFGQFIVEYEVERDPRGGEVLVNDGYFVHFFAPTELEPLPKHVIFVLDVSGSMCGRKLIQLTEAMKVILDELNPNDYFNLVKFSDEASVLNSKYSWETVKIPAESKLPQSFEVTAKNIKAVKDVIDHIKDEGCTNIYDALIVALRLTSKGISHLKINDKKHKPQPIIVFLTDGQPNVSESAPQKIIEMVERRNDCDNKSAVFTLAFGDDADQEFLKELAVQNSGFLRKIYEASDASLQLQDFYKHISSPLLTNVNFKYSEQVKELTKHNFDILFNGSEFVVAGKVDEMVDDFIFVEASTLNGTNQFSPIINITCSKPEMKEEYGSLERLWAYMTIKQLLDKKYEKKESKENSSPQEHNSAMGEQKDGKKNTGKEIAEKQAVDLALKYSFVTPVTSLVVVKPDEDKPVVDNTEQHSGGQVIADMNAAGDWHSLDCDDISYNTGNYRCGDSDSLDRDDISYNTGNYGCASLSRSRRNIKKKKMSFTNKITQFFTGITKDVTVNSVDMVSFHVECSVTNHIATTFEKRRYHNTGLQPQEITFTITLPDKVVPTEFALRGINDDIFQAKGQNGKEAIKEYLIAVNMYNAALIHIENSNKINVKINMRPKAEVTFMLQYKKCLEIKNGKYEVVTNLYRELKTNELIANVLIKEEMLIKNVELSPLAYQNKNTKNKYAKINQINYNEVHIEFNASEKQQNKIVAALNGTNGTFSCEFIIEYEVEPNASTAADTVTSAPVAVPFEYFVAIEDEN